MNHGAVSLQDLIRRRQAAGFVGRAEKLALFGANLEVPLEDPRRRFVFCVHGDGGVGKTFLTRQLQRIAAEHGAVGAYVDEAVFSSPDAMTEIATQLAGQGIAMKNSCVWQTTTGSGAERSRRIRSRRRGSRRS